MDLLKFYRETFGEANFSQTYKKGEICVMILRGRSKHKISQKKLSEITKIPLTDIVAIENGRADAKEWQMKEICTALGITMTPYLTNSYNFSLNFDDGVLGTKEMVIKDYIFEK